MLAALVTVGATGILAAGACTYAAIAPESQLFGRTVIAGRDPAEFALTYDDGPNDPWTSPLLDLLARHNLRATFFLIGRYVRQRPDLVREIRDAGHLIGNHTVSHPWLAVQSPRRVREELAGCNAALEEILGEPVRFFRPPHGSRRPGVLRAARDLGRARIESPAARRRPPCHGRRPFAIRRGYAPHSRALPARENSLRHGGRVGLTRFVPATLPFVPKLARTQRPAVPYR